jgi:hypothetical protein
MYLLYAHQVTQGKKLEMAARLYEKGNIPSIFCKAVQP